MKYMVEPVKERHQPPPSYLSLAQSGELRNRVKKGLAMLERCHVCALACGANRLKDEKKDCKTGRWAVVSSFFPHFGEEPPLVGWGGSGTIFFSQCNLSCLYCQNYEISQLGQGRPAGDHDLAAMMVKLQEWGCHNINLVSPSHVVPQFLAALEIAVERGLSLPIVYNTGGYDSIQTIRLLDGIVDIYMPDMKYSDPAVAWHMSGIKHYPRVNRLVVQEMHRQVGDLVVDEHGIAIRGLLIRHLVLPNDLARTAETVQFIAEEISKDSYVNIMPQYRPCHKGWQNPPMDRPITEGEYAEAVRLAQEAGLWRGF